MKKKTPRCICGGILYKGDTYEWDGVELCSENCKLLEFKKEELWDAISGSIGFDRKGKSLQTAIRDFVKLKQEEVISYIGSTQGWEESEDIYRKYFGFKKKYNKKK